MIIYFGVGLVVAWLFASGWLNKTIHSNDRVIEDDRATSAFTALFLWPVIVICVAIILVTRASQKVDLLTQPSSGNDGLLIPR